MQTRFGARVKFIFGKRKFWDSEALCTATPRPGAEFHDSARGVTLDVAPRRSLPAPAAGLAALPPTAHSAFRGGLCKGGEGRLAGCQLGIGRYTHTMVSRIDSDYSCFTCCYHYTRVRTGGRYSGKVGYGTIENRELETGDSR